MTKGIKVKEKLELMKLYSYKFVNCNVSAILSKEIWAKCVQKTKQWHVLARVFNTIIVDEIKMVHWLRWQISSVTCWYIDLNVLILIHNGLGDKESESAGTRRNNNVSTTSTRRRRRRVDVVKTLSLRHYCVMCPLGVYRMAWWEGALTNMA